MFPPTTSPSASAAAPGVLIATVAILAAVFGAGCAPKPEPPAAAGPPATAAASAPAKPEPWQEEARQKAVQQGPAIEAALQAQQQGR